MRKVLTIIALSLMTLVMMTSSTKQFTIFLIGDSTMANKDIEKAGRERGWGMALQGFFTENVKIDNRAHNGCSTKSFITDGRWKQVLDDMKPGDYLVIQFGHNDEKKKDTARYTEPGLAFSDNYRMFCREAIAKGVTPIIMNAVVRRNFTKPKKKGEKTDVDDEALRGTTGEDSHNSDTIVDSHGLWAIAPINVARDMHVAYVDANKITKDLENGLGVEGSKRLHMCSAVKNGKDNTHYTEYGAHQVASLLVDAMAKVCPELKPFVRHYDYVVSAKGFGNYMTLQAAVNVVPIYAKSSILVLDGEWVKPRITSGKKITFETFTGAKIN